MLDKARDSIRNILDTASGNLFDIYYTLYCEYLEPSEEPVEILRSILQFGGVAQGQNDDLPQHMEKEFAQKTERTYLFLLNEIVDTLILDNPPPQEFYQKLYAYTFASDLFPKDRESRAVILKVLAEDVPCIPYYQAIDLLDMSNEEYKTIALAVKPAVREAVHMLNRHLTSKTKETSQLFRIAEGIEDRTARIVYWSLIMELLRKHERKKPPAYRD